MKILNLLLSASVTLSTVFFLSCTNGKTDGGATVCSNSGKIIAGDTTDNTNDFYDNSETYSLPSCPLTVSGEVEEPVSVDFSKLPLRSVIVKEAKLAGDSNSFTGAYRFDGYSLYDILNNVKLKKANAKEFKPIIDLYVQIENDKGDKVFVSWGEIYYPNDRHQVIIATQVARIVPSVTNELWPLPQNSKLVVAPDLITERNISSPCRIIIKSYPKSLPTQKGMKPMYSSEMKFYNENAEAAVWKGYPENAKEETYETIFYGRGKGIHSTQPFHGARLNTIFNKYLPLNAENIQHGLFVIAGKDGYRGVFTYSEIMNRNDQQEVLLLYRPDDKDYGSFKVFPACDFFSDRAIKGVVAVYYSQEEK